jgi:hypothetical protein
MVPQNWRPNSIAHGLQKCYGTVGLHKLPQK